MAWCVTLYLKVPEFEFDSTKIPSRIDFELHWSKNFRKFPSWFRYCLSFNIFVFLFFLIVFFFKIMLCRCNYWNCVVDFFYKSGIVSFILYLLSLETNNSHPSLQDPIGLDTAFRLTRYLGRTFPLVHH